MKSNSLLSRRAGLVLLGIVLLAAFVFVVARTGPFAPTRVTVVKVAEGSVAPELFGIGTVEARRAYLIGPTASGRVLRVAVDVGEAVKAGQAAFYKRARLNGLAHAGQYRREMEAA